MKRAAALFAVLTVAMLWPLARHLSTLAIQHHDVYFNLWRLQWVAHALATAPSHLFDGNIFYPERGTLALSDAMLLQDVVAAPFLLAGVAPLLVHNVMILLPIAASGLAMFALARHLTGSRGAGVLAGIVFAFAPYRFDHLAHMELQWTMWMPLAFLALHRTLETGSWKYGLATGACLALQMLSCIYYGIFLATLLVPAAGLLAIGDRGTAQRALVKPLAIGAILALTVSAAYAVPFLRQHERVGDRATGEVDAFSARTSSYVSVPAGNAVYGSPGRPGRDERRLFPGAFAVLLALTGLLWRTPTRRQLVYLLVLAAAFEMSLGFGGYSYPMLSRFVPAYRSLRAMARAGIFVVMALSVLAAFGYAALAAGRSRASRWVLVALLASAMLVEYRTSFRVGAFPTAPPAVYRLLASQPRGVVAELPAAVMSALPGPDPEYIYMSTFHWFPLVNGYSGNYPPSYLARIDRLRGFPDRRALEQLRRDNVRYAIVHGASYSPGQLDEIHARLAESGMAELGEYDAWDGLAHLFSIR